ncbi:MAG: putative metallopeptidase [Candidatus Aminicenantes bacterium]|nr:putative metallopeptidase [Candidatus Aminicenantes bacterium]MDH5385026.1 putative metallopeptidase [Candidatus Aminicenantes bacterium]
MPKKKKKNIRYEIADDIQRLLVDIVRTLNLGHIDLDKVVCLRSYGSSARRVIARCHGMSKVLQIAMQIKAFYVLEFISERFDKLDDKEQEETIIHELMHIPKNFGGGFRHHDHVSEENVKLMLERYRKAKNKSKTPHVMN